MLRQEMNDSSIYRGMDTLKNQYTTLEYGSRTSQTFLGQLCYTTFLGKKCTGHSAMPARNTEFSILAFAASEAEQVKLLSER